MQNGCVLIQSFEFISFLSFPLFDVKYVKCVKHVMPTNVFSMTEREILSQRNMTIFFLFTSENISYLKQKRTYLPKIIWFSFLSLHQAFQYFQNISISSFFSLLVIDFCPNFLTILTVSTFKVS